MTAKVRITLEVSVSVRARLESVQARMEAPSMTEVIRRAVAVYSAVLDAQDAGLPVVARDADGRETELLLPREVA